MLLILRTLPEYLAQPSQLWSLSFIESAGDFYGGFLGALAACAINFRRHPELPYHQKCQPHEAWHKIWLIIAGPPGHLVSKLMEALG